MLSEAGKCYGEGIIREYSLKLTGELGKGYSTSSLKRMKQFYLIIETGAPLAHQLTWSHYQELLVLKDICSIKYYIKQIIDNKISKRDLREKIKLREYERLSEEVKNKLIDYEKFNVSDFIKNPIVIRNSFSHDIVLEKILKKLILEDIEFFYDVTW